MECPPFRKSFHCAALHTPFAVRATNLAIIGTAGWWLALEILAAAFPEWQKHPRSVRANYELEVRKLSAALAEHCA